MGLEQVFVPFEKWLSCGNVLKISLSFFLSVRQTQLAGSASEAILPRTGDLTELKMKMNSNEISKASGREEVRRLMFEDGFGFDEAIEHVKDYAIELCHGGATPTALRHITTHIRTICKGND